MFVAGVMGSTLWGGGGGGHRFVWCLSGVVCRVSAVSQWFLRSRF